MMKFIKQSSEILDYDISFANWLPAGDSIASQTTTLENPVDNYLNIVQTVILNGNLVKVWVSGGTNGVTYELKILATTAANRVKEANFKVRIKDQ